MVAKLGVPGVVVCTDRIGRRVHGVGVVWSESGGTAQTSDRQLCSPGSRPMTLTLWRVSQKVRSMTLEWRMRVRACVVA